MVAVRTGGVDGKRGHGASAFEEEKLHSTVSGLHAVRFILKRCGFFDFFLKKKKKQNVHLTGHGGAGRLIRILS